VSPALTVAKTGLNASPTVKMSTVWLVDALESGEVEQAIDATTTRKRRGRDR
jgi:hypothetical protein